ncbi:MAG: hypothetical protein KDE00_03095 [Rhodobacteraceae bacterium]|nr:hypothetical protein [Paracoccaceae bacterium]
MGIEGDTLIGRILFRRTLARWRGLAGHVSDMTPAGLRALRGQARQMRREIDRALQRADARLALPDPGGVAIPRPQLADWAWRPAIWNGRVDPAGCAAVENRTTFGTGAAIFHDCRMNELTVRQIRNTRSTDLSPFALSFDVFRFAGSFLSLVLDLPEAAVAGLKLSHVLRLEVGAEFEAPLEVFARLNVKHGPNTEQLVRELDFTGDLAVAEFDLFHARINERRIERAWLELIFEGPEMNRIVLRDVTMSRRPRAEL